MYSMIINDKTIKIENFLMSSVGENTCKISLQVKDDYFHKLIMENLESIKNFIIDDENKNFIVKNAVPDLIMLSIDGSGSDRIRFISDSVTCKEKLNTEYKNCILSLLDLHDKMYSDYHNTEPLIIQLSGFRRFGNTTILLEIAEKYKILGKKVLIITANKQSCNELNNKIECISIQNAKNYLIGKKLILCYLTTIVRWINNKLTI